LTPHTRDLEALKSKAKSEGLKGLGENDTTWDAAGDCRIVGLLRSVFTLALPEKSTNDLGIRPLSLLGLSILVGDREVINLQ